MENGESSLFLNVVQLYVSNTGNLVCVCVCLFHVLVTLQGPNSVTLASCDVSYDILTRGRLCSRSVSCLLALHLYMIPPIPALPLGCKPLVQR